MSTPNFKTGLIDKVFFIRWEQPPGREDTDTVSWNVLRAYQQVREPMCFIISSGPQARVPNGDERKNLNRLTEEIRKYCSEAHAVLEGNDLRHNLQRVIVSAQSILTRTYDKHYMNVHKNADEVAPHISKRLGVDGKRIISEARSRGLVL